MQFIKSGKLRCIATGTTQRLAQLSDVPTVAEQGYPGFEPAEFAQFIAQEQRRWKPVIGRAKIKPD